MIYITDLIKQLVEFSPNVYLFYGHDHLQSWFEAVDPRKTIAEAQKVKEFVTEYPVAGLILKGIYYDYNIHPDYHVPNDFYVKLKAYVETMKIEIPNLKIGLYLEALSMMFYSKDPKSPDWFDFTVLNKVMDNYIIGFDRFNECTFYLLNGGVVPLNSTDPSINTLTKFKAAFDGSSIARDKVYFEFSINPSVTKKFEKYFIPCEVSYNEYCENQGEYKDCMCVDNQDTFFEKGKFTKENSKGFIAKFIDLVDRDLKCECNDDKYITFTMMLNGYNNLEKLTCAKLSGS
ncbi:uncharacterized protein LOC113554656 [Rhopalosiphum maidis]|uniref:uncharacterized protein LOC113554656 n=1 Tax=Rhopalosiphum maidis TaxID=43146 RepID=UPI00101CB86D|nr:uncharacterized protein LOC113554656 [Rhopalosiphum maidis]